MIDESVYDDKKNTTKPKSKRGRKKTVKTVEAETSKEPEPSNKEVVVESEN